MRHCLNILSVKRNLPNVTLLTINDFTLNASCIFALQQAKTSTQNPNLGALVAVGGGGGVLGASWRRLDGTEVVWQHCRKRSLRGNAQHHIVYWAQNNWELTKRHSKRGKKMERARGRQRCPTVCLSMYSITENIYCSQLSSVAILLQPEPNCCTSYNTRKLLCSLSLSAIVLRSPPPSRASSSNGQRSSQLFCVRYMYVFHPYEALLVVTSIPRFLWD
jgi:hypothetical protein